MRPTSQKIVGLEGRLLRGICVLAEKQRATATHTSSGVGRRRAIRLETTALIRVVGRMTVCEKVVLVSLCCQPCR